MKVHELAKKVGVSSKELIAEIDDPRVSDHRSSVPDSIVTEVLMGHEKKTSESEAEQTQSESADSPEAVVLEAAPITPEEDPKPPKTKAVKVAPKINPELCPHSNEEVELSIRCLGNKSSMWKWRHVLNG